MQILKPKVQDKTKQVNFRIPVELASQIDEVRAAAEARGLVFDVSALVADTLSKAAKAARAELAARAPGQPSG